MSLKNTYQKERAKWDAVAHQKLSASGVTVLSPMDNFHKHIQQESTQVGVADFLGDLHGKHVLEYGCGLGLNSTLLAKSGARVTAFDLSWNSVAVTGRRAALNNVAYNVNLTVSGGENLPYADESFDVIYGKAILHHLDVNFGWFELYRVLKTGGKAAFVEPMGMNPILNLVREYVHYPGKNPRGADRPLNYNEIHAWGKEFSKFCYQEIQLLSMLERGFGFRKRLDMLRHLDKVLLDHLPFLRRYCRYVVLLMVK